MKKELYRDTEKGKIAGVCAGLAEYFGWELWLVRIIFISGFLLTGSFFFMAYVIGWFVLDKKNPEHVQKNPLSVAADKSKGWVSNLGDDVKVEVKSKVWQAGEPPKQAFKDIHCHFGKLELRLHKMESYVTSSEFQLNREFNKL
ncbi:envelope stress response membrane protein PspC [Planctobacterium marinum]|uniref:Phage shock protein C n=1 Tax=Planctobacterium marinum TaxID=1631968 RepID=A0AA48HJ86_9ALTE|nr:phage shock protein C [Planctobacterium marinum]